VSFGQKCYYAFVFRTPFHHYRCIANKTDNFAVQLPKHYSRHKRRKSAINHARVSLVDWLLSTHADRQGVDISVTVCVFVFCTVTDFSGEDKASGVKFCKVVQGRPGRGMSHLWKLCSPEAQNRTNRPST